MRERNKLSERQRNIIKYMQTYIESNGFPPTIREIGAATGINSTSVVNYNLNKLVQAGEIERFGHTSRGLRLMKQNRRREVQPVAPAPAPLRVPLMGQIVAGKPFELPSDVGHHYDEDSLIEVMPSLLHGLDPAEVFALRVKGDSMVDAMIRNGDIVIFKRENTAQDGQMVAVWLTDRNETTLKYFFNEGERIRLQPAHPTMDAIYVNANSCEVQGRVLSVIRPAV